MIILWKDRPSVSTSCKEVTNFHSQRRASMKNLNCIFHNLTFIVTIAFSLYRGIRVGLYFLLLWSWVLYIDLHLVLYFCYKFLLKFCCRFCDEQFKFNKVSYVIRHKGYDLFSCLIFYFTDYHQHHCSGSIRWNNTIPVCLRTSSFRYPSNSDDLKNDIHFYVSLIQSIKSLFRSSIIILCQM